MEVRNKIRGMCSSFCLNPEILSGLISWSLSTMGAVFPFIAKVLKCILYLLLSALTIQIIHVIRYWSTCSYDWKLKVQFRDLWQIFKFSHLVYPKFLFSFLVALHCNADENNHNVLEGSWNANKLSIPISTPLMWEKWKGNQFMSINLK